MKLLGAELRAGDYVADAWLTGRGYRKAQTNREVPVGEPKAGGKCEMSNLVIAHHRHTHEIADHELQHRITKLIENDPIANASRRFATGVLTLLWLGDSSVVDADTV